MHKCEVHNKYIDIYDARHTHTHLHTHTSKQVSLLASKQVTQRLKMLNATIDAVDTLICVEPME